MGLNKRENCTHGAAKTSDNQRIQSEKAEVDLEAEMKYRFKFGRGKKVVISGNDTFETLGFKVLKGYHISPEHLFSFEFENGDMTDSASPLGPINDGMGNVSIETRIKDRKMEIGEALTLVYDYSSDWRKKVKLDGME